MSLAGTSCIAQA